MADKRRGNSNQRSYTYQWSKTSKGFLAKHPLCIACERHGLVVAATVVDHVIPHRGDKALFWDRANWQPLCETCHNRKTGSGA